MKSNKGMNKKEKNNEIKKLIKSPMFTKREICCPKQKVRPNTNDKLKRNYEAWKSWQNRRREAERNGKREKEKWKKEKEE